VIAEVLERLIAFAARDEAVVVSAREEWAALSGKVFDDDSLYEERTTAFLEWFALERPGADGRVPGERFLAEERLDDLEGRWLDALLGSHRSLFAVQQMKPGYLMLDDLLGGGLFQVTERRKLPGVAEGEIFEARLVPNVVTPPELLFTRALQYHPREAAAEVRRLAEAARKSGAPKKDVLFKLARLRLKALRYGHVAAAKIYAGDDAAP
jgi:hypothetical protein